MSEFPIVPMAQWVRQQGFETVGAGSNTRLYLHFLNFINTTENIDTPPLFYP